MDIIELLYATVHKTDGSVLLLDIFIYPRTQIIQSLVSCEPKYGCHQYNILGRAECFLQVLLSFDDENTTISFLT